MTAYADVDDLEVFLGQAAPDLPSEDVATRMLLRASELVDDYVKTAYYRTDSEHMPTDDVVIVALRDATCAQVEFWFAGDEEDDILGALQSIDIGGVSAKPQTPMTLAPRAARILRVAHVYSMEPRVL